MIFIGKPSRLTHIHPVSSHRIWQSSLSPPTTFNRCLTSSAFPETRQTLSPTIGIEWWTASLTRLYRRCHSRNGTRACVFFCVSELETKRIAPSGLSTSDNHVSGAFDTANELPTESSKSFASRSATTATRIVSTTWIWSTKQVCVTGKVTGMRSIEKIQILIF